ncbi:MAG: hypothetical protein QOH21_1422 [Acidobacteriota bacterium]|nr:hypothetical protein [Acidobacteriota bacterium]
MKPIHLNLAARPYRDYRPVYAAVVLMSLLTAFLMLNNVDTYYRYVHETKATRAKIAQRETQAAQERDREAISKRRLGQLDLVQLDDQTRFINAQLAERAFSWSVLLDELETIMGDDVRLISVSPTFDPDGSVKLALSFETKSANGLIETMNRMHAHPKFQNPFPSNETMLDGGGYSFVLTVDYLVQPRQIANARTVAR